MSVRILDSSEGPCSDILYAVAMRLVGDGDAWGIVNQAHSAVVDAYCWICPAKLIGEPKWEKAGAA